MPASLAALFASLVLAGTAAAAGADAGCPEGNLLAGRLPASAPAALAVLSDGRVTPEGALWSSPPAFVLGSGDPQLTFDLGGERAIHALLLQADANDAYPIASSLDGITFEPLVTVSPVAGNGLRTRAPRLPGRSARYLRLDAPQGDGAFAVAELAVYCAVPAPWPPRVEVVAAPLDEPQSEPRWAWNDVTSRWWELLLAIAGAAALLWHRRSAGVPRLQRTADRLLAVLGVLAALTYFNFGAFHFGNFIHNWDTFHYYVGAKYFRELGYDGLYECVAVADAQEPGGRARVEARPITNLRTNVLETTAEILASPERCTVRFTPERWAAFRHDVAWFRARETPQRWDEVSTDHGYNATPVWNAAGSLLANLAPASDRQVLALTLLDPLYFLGICAVIAWAFGWRPLAVALLVLATYFPCRFFWTGGAFLRWDWLFWMVAAVACVRKGRPFLGGAALGYAALLRIFPGVLALGPLLALGIAAFRERSSAAGAAAERQSFALGAFLRGARARPHLRFLAGAAVAAALLLPAGAAVGGGFEAYRGFVANSRKHQGTPLTNNMGLRTAITYRPAEVGRHLVSDQATDPWQRWKSARLEAWAESRLVAAVLLWGMVALLAVAIARNPEPWLAPALAAVTIAFAFELTSYYYAFLIVPALLWARWRPAGPWLLALAAFSQLVSLAPLPGLSTWRDEQYTWISMATLLVLLLLVARYARGLPAGVEEPERR